MRSVYFPFRIWARFASSISSPPTANRVTCGFGLAVSVALKVVIAHNRIVFRVSGKLSVLERR